MIHTHSLDFRNHKVTLVTTRAHTLKTFVKLLADIIHQIT